MAVHVLVSLLGVCVGASRLARPMEHGALFRRKSLRLRGGETTFSKREEVFLAAAGSGGAVEESVAGAWSEAPSGELKSLAQLVAIPMVTVGAAALRARTESSRNFRERSTDLVDSFIHFVLLERFSRIAKAGESSPKVEKCIPTVSWLLAASAVFWLILQPRTLRWLSIVHAFYTVAHCSFKDQRPNLEQSEFRRILMLGLNVLLAAMNAAIYEWSLLDAVAAGTTIWCLSSLAANPEFRARRWKILDSFLDMGEVLDSVVDNILFPRD